MITLGGFTMVRNGDLLDYCWRECVQSMLPVCDTVTICVAPGDDDTELAARAWTKRDPKVKVCIYPWDHPKGDPDFFVKWIQYAREHTQTDFVLELDADEVLSEKSYGLIASLKNEANGRRFSAWCKRYNFWHDAQHLIPHGVCCGHYVVRFGPQNLWMPSDGAHPNGEAFTSMAKHTDVEIFHYGFIRKRDAFFRKAKSLQSFFFNSYDPRLVHAEKVTEKGGNWMEHCSVGWEKDLIPFRGEHPKLMHNWLIERGLSV